MARIVQLDWSRACRWDKGLPHFAEDIGIYQLTREFGGWDSLLYIGIVWSDSRTFFTRMQEHRKAWLGELRGIRYRFATIRPLRGLSRTRTLVEEIEGALICQLQPPENTSKKSFYSLRSDLVIHSGGDRGWAP